MSPLEIEIMLHYYTTPGDYRDGDFSAPAVRQAIDDLVAWEMLVPRRAAFEMGRMPSSYDVSKGGVLFIDALKAVPRPQRIVRWVIPEQPQIETPACLDEPAHVAERMPYQHVG